MDARAARRSALALRALALASGLVLDAAPVAGVPPVLLTALNCVDQYRTSADPPARVSNLGPIAAP